MVKRGGAVGIIVMTVLWLFIINFIITSYIYPIRVKNRIKKSLVDTRNIKSSKIRLKIGAYTYFKSIIDCVVLILLFYAICTWVQPGIKSQYIIANIVAVSYLTVAGLLMTYNFIRLVVLLPKKYFEYDNGNIYYHNGIKEKCIEQITEFKEYEYRQIFYWSLKIKSHNKWITIHLLNFSNPETIYKIINMCVKK